MDHQDQVFALNTAIQYCARSTSEFLWARHTLLDSQKIGQNYSVRSFGFPILVNIPFETRQLSPEFLLFKHPELEEKNRTRNPFHKADSTRCCTLLVEIDTTRRNFCSFSK